MTAPEAQIDGTTCCSNSSFGISQWSRGPLEPCLPPAEIMADLFSWNVHSKRSIQVREKLGNTMSIQTYNTQRKGLCPPQLRAIQRQTSEVGALQYQTKYELIEQRMRQ